MSKTILVLGNSISDHVFYLSEPVSADGKQFARKYDSFIGGQASNVAIALALLGHQVDFVSAFGTDPSAQFCADGLKEIGVNTRHCQPGEGCAHPSAVILVHGAARSITMYRDPKLALSVQEMSDLDISAYDLLYSDGYEWDAFLYLARQAVEAGIPVVTDLEAIPDCAQDGLTLVDHLVSPAAIVHRLYDQQDLSAALRSASMSLSATVVATQGALGSRGVAKTTSDIIHVPAKGVTVIDSTGAGDAFHAGYSHALLTGAGLSDRMTFATQLAALKCQQPGPRLQNLNDLD